LKYDHHTMDTKQITHHTLQMDKFNREGNYGNIMPLLTALDNACVTCEQLQDTDIVRVIYRLLNTCSDHSVKKTAKHLLSKWKKLYSHPYHISKQKGSREEFTVIGESMLADKACLADRGGLAAGDASKPVELGAASSSSLVPSIQKLPRRQRGGGLHIHERHRANEAKYKACIRGKVANLTNNKNGHLRFFAGMSVEEMANEELQRQREEYSSWGVSDRQLSQDLEGTPTQKLRCEGSDCRVTRVSRGTLFLPAWVRQATADQDAMTFVTCSRFGEQWYHSGWLCL
uniref:TFIIS N-terminal domain-containing protein n=1 Tax=Oncorhynchus tshawytscha TaxID=74940 RepID=A0A8C8EU21_ONCTS